MPELALLGAVRAIVTHGNTFGIVLQDDLRRFMELCFSHGHSFLEQERFSPLLWSLQRADLDGTQKMDEVDRRERAILMGRA
jgi:hypothetical protein